MAVALDSEIARRQAVVLRGRALMACGACGWVHYVMTQKKSGPAIGHSTVTI